MVRGRFVAAAGVASLALAVLPAVGAHAGLDPVPPGFRATQVSAISSTNWWVLGSVPGCGGHRCNAIAHTTNGGVSFSLEKTSAHSHGTPDQGNDAADVRRRRPRVGPRARSARSGFQLWRTSNAGWTWTRVPRRPPAQRPRRRGRQGLGGRPRGLARAGLVSVRERHVGVGVHPPAGRTDRRRLGIARTRRAGRRQGPGAELPPGRQPVPRVRRQLLGVHRAQRPDLVRRLAGLRPGVLVARDDVARLPDRAWLTRTAIRRAAASAGMPAPAVTGSDPLRLGAIDATHAAVSRQGSARPAPGLDRGRTSPSPTTRPCRAGRRSGSSASPARPSASP